MRKGLLIVWGVLACAASLTAVAQVTTAEQMEMLRNMAPEDRQSLKEQIGLGGSSMGDGSSSGSERDR